VNVLETVKPGVLLRILNRGSKSGIAAECPSLEEELTRQLRTLVDEWLRTARDASGAETPQNRRISGAPLARRAVAEYLKKSPPTLLPHPEFAIVAKLCDPDDLIPDWQPQFYFASLLLSDWRLSFGKCTFCKIYFVKTPNRKRYKNGLFCCAKHNAKQTAVKATRQTRDRIESHLVQRAATFLRTRKLRPSARLGDQPLKLRLSEALQRHLQKSGDPDLIGYRKRVRISVKWVSRHQKQIEEVRQKLFCKTQRGIRGDEGSPSRAI
jgi:hypothetical protein